MKIKKTSKKRKRTGPIITVIIAVGIIASAVYLYNEQKSPNVENNQWVTSGPFSIDNSKYRLGDNVFISVRNLQPNEVGTVVVSDPKGDTFTTIPFNGTMKSSFNMYFKPNTEAAIKLCKPTDLVGKWSIIFKGVPYKSISFEITNDWVPGSQKEIYELKNC